MASAVSWHLRYYDYSFLAYVCASAAFVGFYAAVYCLRTPAIRVPQLVRILQDDPVIEKNLLERLEERDRRRLTDTWDDPPEEDQQVKEACDGLPKSRMLVHRDSVVVLASHTKKEESVLLTTKIFEKEVLL